MLKRYIGQQPVQVVVAGQHFGSVENGDSIVVPDDLANSVDWPTENWDNGPAKDSKADKSATPAKSATPDKSTTTNDKEAN